MFEPGIGSYLKPDESTHTHNSHVFKIYSTVVLPSNRLRAGRLGLESQQGQNFSLLHNVQTGSGARPASYPMDTGGDFPGRVKRPGREADHWPPSSSEVKNGGAIPPSPPYAFMTQCLINWTQGQLFLLPYLFPSAFPFKIFWAFIVSSMIPA
jgi:hypothetical protein